MMLPDSIASRGDEVRQGYRRSLRAGKMKALGSVAPLLIFIAITFVGPIFLLLRQSILTPDMRALLPLTASSLDSWHGPALPPETTWASLVADLKNAESSGDAMKIAGAVNQQETGSRKLIMSAAEQAGELKPPFSISLSKLDPAWQNPSLWGTIKRLSSGWTMSYYANALDLQITGTGNIEPQPEDRRIYLSLFGRTLKVATIVTLLCLLLAYPLSSFLAKLKPRLSAILMMFVLLPFWTSLLVRTTAWIALLQKQGVINDLLVWAGLVKDENRLALIYNEVGTLVAMTHVLLPFMILPLHAVMKSIPPTYTRAAASLGARPLTNFYRIYLPQTMPGVGAGCLLVFILAIGYYITPSLVGGDSGALISNLIAYHIQKSLNWGLAAALSTLLLAGVTCLFWLYDRIVGLDRLALR